MSFPLLPIQWVVHQTLNLNMLMNLMFLSLPMGTTWRLFGSSASNPTKQPTVFLVLSEVMKGDGVAIMLIGTSVRIRWLLAKKFDPSRVMDNGILLSRRPITSRAFLLKLGAMGTLVFAN